MSTEFTMGSEESLVLDIGWLDLALVLGLLFI